MTVLVVDPLELVEIEEQERDRRAVPAAAGDCLFQTGPVSARWL